MTQGKILQKIFWNNGLYSGGCKGEGAAERRAAGRFLRITKESGHTTKCRHLHIVN